MEDAYLVSFLEILNVVLGAITLYLLLRSAAVSRYWPLTFIALWNVIPTSELFLLRTFRYLSPQLAYNVYFYTYWSAFALSAIFSALLTYSIFQDALRPLKGLQSLGVVMYRWVAGISVLVLLSLLLSPVDEANPLITQIVSEAERLSGILIMCLLLFVGFTVKPLGLTLRNRTFGVSLGMALILTAHIISSSAVFKHPYLYNRAQVVVGLAQCIAQLIWIWYFSVPEPQRQFLLLPTTSPFHQWNLVSERMGYDPGYVAIGGVPPESLAEAEFEYFRRIAEQDAKGEAPQVTAPRLPAGFSLETQAATERFHRIWNMRYQHEPGDRESGSAPSEI